MADEINVNEKFERLEDALHRDHEKDVLQWDDYQEMQGQQGKS